MVINSRIVDTTEFIRLFYCNSRPKIDFILNSGSVSMSQLSRVPRGFEVWVVMGCHGVFRLKGHEGAGEPPGHPWRNVEGEEGRRKMRKCKYATYMPNMPHILHVLIIYYILCHLCIGISRPLLACDQRKSTVKIR